MRRGATTDNNVVATPPAESLSSGATTPPVSTKQKSSASSSSKKRGDADGEKGVHANVVGRVALLTLSAVPICFALKHLRALGDDHILVFLVGVVICTLIGGLGYSLVFVKLPPKVRRDPYLYFFTVFAFTAVVDVQLALNIDGVLDNLRFYLQEGEKYLGKNRFVLIMSTTLRMNVVMKMKMSTLTTMMKELRTDEQIR